MNPAKKGLATSGKVGIVVVLVLLVLGGAYLAPSLLTGGGTSSTSSQSAGSTTSAGTGNPGPGLLSLFNAYSQMQMQSASYDNGEAVPLIESHTYSYLVLGKATLNSTQYVKVQFSQQGSSTNVISWFNPQGGIDRVDVLGVKNYTGAISHIYAALYVGAFSLISGLSNNSTILAILKQTSQNTTSFGPTQLVVTTYSLAAPTAPYTSLTIRFATIPGTNTRFAVYYDEKTNDMMENTYQILSLTK
jgi:hypothetical protein